MIYFLKRRDENIKLGTTENYHVRLSDLIRRHGDLELLGLMEGNKEVEFKLHEQFDDLRIGRTEWFKPADELMNYIASNAHLNIPEKTRPHLSDRIPCHPETHDRLREFCLGLGAKLDEGLNFLLDKVIGDEEPLIAGRRLRDEIKKRKQA